MQNQYLNGLEVVIVGQKRIYKWLASQLGRFQVIYI